MSKKKNISYLFSLALLLLAGCESNTATVTPLEEEAVEVRLRASVCTIETTVSRSVIEGTTLKAGDTVGIFLMKDNRFSTSYLQNLQYKCSEDGQLKLQPEGSKVYYPPQEDVLYLYGYYPYTEETITDENGKILIPVTAALQTSEATDYLYGSATGTKTEAAAATGITIPLNHALARLRLNITTNRPEYTVQTYPILQSISFTTHEGQKGKMDLQTGIITSDNPNAGTTVSSDYRSNTAPLGIVPGESVTQEYLLLPYDSTASALNRLAFSIKEPDETTEKEIIVFDEAGNGTANPPTIKLEAGKTTTLNIIYTQSMAAKASVNDWDKGTEHTFQ